MRPIMVSRKNGDTGAEGGGGEGILELPSICEGLRLFFDKRASLTILFVFRSFFFGDKRLHTALSFISEASSRSLKKKR